MTNKQVALDVAAFFDSPEARALLAEGEHGRALREAEVRKVAELFLSICYDEVGSKPRLLDGHDVHGIVGHLLPARMARRDPLAEHVPAVLRAYLDHLAATQVVSQAFEQRRALEGTLDEFQQTVDSGHNAHAHAPKQDPFVHKAAKLGRNDPCSCGSGKKYKKCHGKDA